MRHETAPNAALNERQEAYADAVKEQLNRVVAVEQGLVWALTKSRDERRRKLARQIAEFVETLREVDPCPLIVVGLLKASLDDWERRYERQPR